MNKKEIVNVHKRPDGVFEIECFEKPLRTQITDLEQENKQLKHQLEMKDVQISVYRDFIKLSEQNVDVIKRNKWTEITELKHQLAKKNIEIRKQVCDEIREKLKKQIIPTAGSWLSYYDITETNNLLDQIEQENKYE